VPQGASVAPLRDDDKMGVAGARKSSTFTWSAMKSSPRWWAVTTPRTPDAH